MARPIWTGTLSFGLLNVPVSLMTGERRDDVSFRMLDARNNQPVRYERVNAETGEEVPWKDVVKAYEYEKGNYVVIDKDDIKAAAPERHESIDVETFVDADRIGVRFYDKPYILVPGKKAEKGYVLLRETLKSTGKVGIARVVIRTREYLSAVLPEEDALVMMLLRYPKELVALDEYDLPHGKPESFRVSAREMDMASELIESMSAEWQPDEYHDELRDRLTALIEERVQQKGGKAKIDEAPHVPEHAATNVVDFMALLKKSLDSKKRTEPNKPAAKKRPAATKKAASKRKGPAKTRPTKKTATKKKAG
jgi:DNA end-binding protein Ku